jgi:hypothetical protein
MTEHPINLTALASARDGTGHSIFSPSGSAMWLTCSGSLIPNILAPDDAGEDAAEGTVAHAIGEEWLRTGIRPDWHIGKTEYIETERDIFAIPITVHMLDFVQEYVDWCEMEPGDHYVETRVDFSDLTPIPRQSGTADFAACSYQYLNITDLKYGKGEIVYAANNTQALLYAYGFFRMWDWLYDFQRIRIRIAQPRLNHFDEWEITREELLAFAEYAKERAALAWQHNAPRTASEKGCRWCKVKVTCAAHAKLMFDLTADAFDNLDAQALDTDQQAAFVAKLEAGDVEFNPLHPSDLTVAQLAKIVQFRGMMESWFAAIETYLEDKALAGEKIPDHKLVESRTNRVFKNETAARDHLIELGIPEEKLYSRKMISPAQAEEVIREVLRVRRKDLPVLLEDYVFKPRGKPTLVPLTDKREELVELADESFENLDLVDEL